MSEDPEGGGPKDGPEPPASEAEGLAPEQELASGEPDPKELERSSVPPSERSLAERMPRILPVDEGPGSKRRRILFFGIVGVFLVALVYVFRAVLLPFLLAIIIAYVFAPVVKAMERAMPRWVAVVSLYVVLIGVLGGVIYVGVPRLVLEVERLVRELPDAVRTVRDQWLPEVEQGFRDAMAAYAPEGVAIDPVATVDPLEPDDPREILVQPTPEGGYAVRLPDGGLRVTRSGAEGYRIDALAPEPTAPTDFTTTVRQALARQVENTEGAAVTVLKTAQVLLTTILRGAVTFSLMLMLSAYLLATSESIFGFLKSLVRPTRRHQFDALLTRIDRGLSGVVRGQLIIALVNGLLSGIGFYLFDLPYWPILTVFATLLSVIPIFGAIISSVPAVLFGLQEGVGTALGVLAWIIGIHQIEANLLNPKIMGDAAKVHPVLVVFALLAGEHLFGLAGALLAVPVLSILQSLFLHYREVALGVARPAAESTSSRHR
ncbi:MAG: AI-2E family transporter [Myxococcota bacterium]